MARKDENVAGVFIVRDTDSKMAYIGKSKGLGSIMRSVKSKLKARKFSNEALQDDWIQYEGEGFEFVKIELPEGESLKEFHDLIRKKYIGKEKYNGEVMGYGLYNDITYIDKVETKDISEISHLNQYERRFILMIIENIRSIDIDALTTTIERGLENN